MKNLINRSKYDKIAYNIEKLNYGMITERNGKRMDKTQDTIELLRIYKQEHIIKLLNQLEGKEKEELIEQINIENIAYLDKAKLSKDQKEEFDSLGEIAIRNKEYAVVTMAGGQGSRLRT